MLNSTWKRAGTALFAAGLLALGACGDDGDDDDGAGDTTEGTAAGGGDAGTDDTGGGTGGVGGADTLTISNFSFSDTTAAPGATVSVTNEDGAPHTVTSDDDAWDEVQVGGSGTGEFTAPEEPGDYPFHCEIHTTMTGTLVVE